MKDQYSEKYKKYKTKYLKLKHKLGGTTPLQILPQIGYFWNISLTLEQWYEKKTQNKDEITLEKLVDTLETEITEELKRKCKVRFYSQNDILVYINKTRDEINTIIKYLPKVIGHNILRVEPSLPMNDTFIQLDKEISSSISILERERERTETTTREQRRKKEAAAENIILAYEKALKQLKAPEILMEPLDVFDNEKGGIGGNTEARQNYKICTDGTA